MTEQAIFLSDGHFGANPPNAVPNREEHFCTFLETLQNRAAHLFILGDMFEFWMEYKFYIPKNHFSVLAALYKLRKSGTEIHYIEGNHDFNLGSFFCKHLGIKTHKPPFQITIQGVRLCLLHGDGMAHSDSHYRFFKKILRHSSANRFFRLIHPDWGMKLALQVGRLFRFRQPSISFKEYHEAAKHYFQKGANAVLYGHTHRTYFKDSEEGVEINTGNWVTQMHFVVLKQGKFSLHSYNPSHPPTF